MKTVFNNSEVAHLWANASQSYAQSSNGNFYFQDNLIYSYGSHYVAGNRVSERVFILNSNFASMTTASKHMPHVRRSIAGSCTVFHLPNLDVKIGAKHCKNEHKENIKFLFDSLRKNEQKFHTSRVYKDEYLQAVQNLQIEIGNYCTEFKCKSLLTKNQKSILESEFEELTSYFERENAALKKKRTIERKKREKQRNEQIECNKHEDVEKLERWLNFEISYAQFHYDKKVYLRIKNDQVQTSMGANVPIDRAKQLWPLILHSYKNQYHWIENGENFKIGSYRIQEILPNGDVKAGCHYITFDVLLDMAKQLELQLPE